MRDIDTDDLRRYRVLEMKDAIQQQLVPIVTRLESLETERLIAKGWVKGMTATTLAGWSALSFLVSSIIVIGLWLVDHFMKT